MAKMEIAKIEKNLTMDSREIAGLLGKQHKHVLRDIETQLGGMPNFGHTYINEQNKQEYKCYKLPYRETMILISGYSVELRTKIVDRWLELEKTVRGNRQKSIETRNHFTSVLQEHGCDAPIHYIKITATMKKNVGINGNKKKDDFNQKELMKISMAETLSSLWLDDAGADGYDQCKPICQTASASILSLIAKKPDLLLA